MQNKTLDKMIPQALQEAKKFADQHNKVESKYFSAVANFGASILQSGIYATKLFYEAKGDTRNKIPNMICTIIKDAKGIDKPFINHQKEDILNATTALKLAIRTFEKIDNKEFSDE